MTISHYIAEQLRQALGADNKWYCSQHYGREITDPETLLRYYIKHGGATRFAQDHTLVHSADREPQLQTG